MHTDQPTGRPQGPVAEGPTMRPAEWVDAQLEQVGERRNMRFRIADDGGWTASAIRRSRILNVRVRLCDDGRVYVAVNSGHTVPPDKVDEYRIFQMDQNSRFVTRGYERAEAGEPVSFAFRIAPAEDVDLAEMVDNAIITIVEQEKAFEAIDRGRDVSEICFGLMEEHLRRSVLRMVCGLAAQQSGE